MSETEERGGNRPREFHTMFVFHSIKIRNETSPLLRNVKLVHFSKIGEMLEHHLL